LSHYYQHRARYCMCIREISLFSFRAFAYDICLTSLCAFSKCNYFYSWYSENTLEKLTKKVDVLTLIRMNKDEKNLAVFKGLML
jgi:hypothetical protein